MGSWWWSGLARRRGSHGEPGGADAMEMVLERGVEDGEMHDIAEMEGRNDVVPTQPGAAR